MCQGAFLRCPYANARRMRNKEDELEMFVQMQGHCLVGVMETWWDYSHNECGSGGMPAVREGLAGRMRRG